MSTLNSYATANLGTTQIAVFTCKATKSAVIIGSNVANKLDVTIFVDIKLRKGGVDYFLLRKVMIPPNTAYISSGDEQKLVLNEGDTIQMVSSVASSADVIISASEFEASV